MAGALLARLVGDPECIRIVTAALVAPFLVVLVLIE